MSTPAEVNAARVQIAPVQNAADPIHETGLIFRVAHSATSAQATVADIPANMRGRYWRLLALGANVNFGFLCADALGNTPTAPTLVYGQLSATGTGHLAAAETLLDSQPEHIECPENARRVVFISSSAATAPAAYFEAVVSGRQSAVKVK